jgi:dTDP-4-amino-4,6-dideoxygalactose transaminase
MDQYNYNIPFNRPFIVGKELHYISQAVLSGKISGDGIFTKKCHNFIEEQFHATKALLTTSCTSALEMAALLIDIQHGDEIIVPSYTFVSTANAFVLHGAKPVFVDIREDTLNIDETKIEQAITPKTKCIVPVHYAGIGCEMNSIMTIAKKHNLAVIEDSAQGVNAQYNNQYLGTIGDLGTYSFHETKNFICGEGGALIVNREDLILKAEIIREKGTNRTQFFKGLVDKYTWIDKGSSFLPSEILAAFLYAQLEQMETITKKRKAIFDFYYENLLELEKNGFLRLSKIPPECKTNYHMFYILLNDEETRDTLMAYLGKNNVMAVFHYIPLHTSPFGQKCCENTASLPVTEKISKRLLRLPFYYELSTNEQAKVVSLINDFFRHK